MRRWWEKAREEEIGIQAGNHAYIQPVKDRVAEPFLPPAMLMKRSETRRTDSPISTLDVAP